MQLRTAWRSPCLQPTIQIQQALKKYSGFLLVMLIAACGQAQPRGPSAVANVTGLQRYNLSKPDIINLPESVREISGINYHETDHSVFAIDDEQGNLFKIKLQKSPVVEQWPVSNKNDYEDLVISGKTVYLLSSRGSIIYFPYAFPVKEVVQAELAMKGRNEFEILLKDPAADRLLMMCKSCRDDKKGEVSVYGFSLSAKSFNPEPLAVLKVKEIEDGLNEKVGQFKPSGANVHPLTGEIYIVSSINQLLVVTDKTFKVKEVHKLDASLFKQPEGLAFTPTGDLLISNESAGKGSANILFFKQNF